MEIEFGIFKTQKGKFACYHVTLPGGDAITRAFVEERANVTEKRYQGAVSMWVASKGFGWISPSDLASFPADIKKALETDSKKRQEKMKKQGKKLEFENAIYVRNGDKAGQGERLAKGDKVEFKLYTDTQGVGACDVTKL